jgi:hypothetical protein
MKHTSSGEIFQLCPCSLVKPAMIAITITVRLTAVKILFNIVDSLIPITSKTRIFSLLIFDKKHFIDFNLLVIIRHKLIANTSAYGENALKCNGKYFVKYSFIEKPINESK